MDLNSASLGGVKIHTLQSGLRMEDRVRSIDTLITSSNSCPYILLVISLNNSSYLCLMFLHSGNSRET